MASILQRIKLGVKAPNDDAQKRAKKEVSPPLFSDADERLCRDMSFEEQVVYKSQKLYRDPENGLCKISRELGAPEPEVPERKINILIIGNHSSGKSSFINWYVDAQIQKTGVAMETSNFTVVCHGQRRETLTANAVVKLFPALVNFEKIPGAMDHLSGEVCTSTGHQFKLVNFIDSPGIVDGERYDFDFDRALEVCADMADLVFVFLDPHGQALCQRTMAHLERLCMSQPSKLSLWMTKCDTVRGDADLIKVTQQISRELARRPQIARQELWLNPIYVPGLSGNQRAELNHIKEAQTLIDKSIAANLQNKVLCNIGQLCSYLEKLNAEKVAAEERHNTKRVSSLAWLRTFLYLTIMFAVITIGLFVVEAEYLAESLENIVDPRLVVNLKTRFHKSLTEHIQPEMEMPVLAGVLFCVAVLAWLGAREPPAEHVKEDDRITRPWYRNNIDRINNIRQEADQLLRAYRDHTLDV